MAYTPLFDPLLKIASPTDALVFGAVWRFAQGELGKCIASPETIGERIGVTGRTVKRSLKILCDQGLLEDKTPNIMHKPHDHVPTKKALTLIGEVGQNVIPKPDEVGQSDIPRDDKMSYQVGQNVPARYDKLSHIRKKEETTKKQSKKKSGDKPPAIPERRFSPKQQIFLITAELCNINLKVASGKQKGQLDTASKALVKVIRDPPQFKKDFRDFWYKEDWRGKEGQTPTPHQVQDTYGDFENWLKNGKISRNGANHDTQRTHPGQRGPAKTPRKRKRRKAAADQPSGVSLGDP